MSNYLDHLVERSRADLAVVRPRLNSLFESSGSDPEAKIAEPVPEPVATKPAPDRRADAPQRPPEPASERLIDEQRPTPPAKGAEAAPALPAKATETQTSENADPPLPPQADFSRAISSLAEELARIEALRSRPAERHGDRAEHDAVDKTAAPAAPRMAAVKSARNGRPTAIPPAVHEKIVRMVAPAADKNLPSRRPDADPEHAEKAPPVQVVIDRIDVHAAAPSAAPKPRRLRQQPDVPLDRYLLERRGGD